MMASKDQRICGLVVTFNRKNFLRRNLEALLRQTRPPDDIVVLDNAATDGTKEYVGGLLSGDPRFNYLRLDDNVGGAGGFHEGIKAAMGMGADYVWGMDDDALPEPEALEKLCDQLPNVPPGSCLYSSVQWTAIAGDGAGADLERTPRVNGIERVEALTFSGFLLSRQAVMAAGYPRKDFFIYFDDLEYSRRLRRAGFEIYLVKDSVTRHPEIHTKRTYSMAGIRVSLHFMPAWKWYYFIRNGLLLYGFGDVRKYHMAAISLWVIFKMMLLERANLRSTIEGFVAGLFGRSGKRP